MQQLLHTPHWLLATAVSLLSIALSLNVYHLLNWLYKQHRIKKQLLTIKNTQNTLLAVPSSSSQTPTTLSTLQKAFKYLAKLGAKWKTGRYGTILLAEEDKLLIDLSGFYDSQRAQAIFIVTRTLLSLGLPLLFFSFAPSFTLLNSFLLSWIICGFIGFALGWMLPKIYLQRHVKNRKKAIKLELLLFLDMLRLLQGVGLSIDQALITITDQFKDNIPVLAYELALAQDLYTRGRTREQSFNRLIHHYQNEDLSAICRLIQQIDVHGGAVQEPLAQFSSRLQEERRLSLKERIGILTVKMTGVMIVTLMPALIIVTGGAGFLAILRGLSRVTGG